MVYYDGYGYNIYYGTYGYYEYSVNPSPDTYSGSSGGGGGIAGVIVYLCFCLVAFFVFKKIKQAQREAA